MPKEGVGDGGVSELAMEEEGEWIVEWKKKERWRFFSPEIN